MIKIPVAEPDIGPVEEEYVSDAMRSGWVSSLGPYLTRFEQQFAKFCDVDHGLTTSNGTSALLVTLRALGVGPGDEVIVPALTFAAVPAVVVSLGATPVLVDIEESSWCLDPEATERALSPSTRAVVAVHSYGHPADLDALSAVCGIRGIHLIEDCAEAHGARYKGRVVGSVGVAGVFSFYGNKIITTGEGGMVTTNDAALAERIRFLRDHAMEPGRRYFHSEVGYNLRLTNVQAAMGCAQLTRIDDFLAKRAEILQWYREELAELDGITLNPTTSWAEPVNWMVCVRLRPDIAPYRDAILENLSHQGVDTRPFFVPLHELPPYKSARRVGTGRGSDLDVATAVGSSAFNLPSSTRLTRREVERTGSALRAAMTRVSTLPFV